MYLKVIGPSDQLLEISFIDLIIPSIPQISKMAVKDLERDLPESFLVLSSNFAKYVF